MSAAIGFGVGFISSVAADLISGNEVNWGAAFASGGFGALSGALAVLPMPTGAFVAANAAISGLDSAVNQGLHNGFDNINYGEVALDTAIGAVSSRNGPDLSASDSKHIIKQTKNYKKKISSSASRHTSARSNASKYYRSQTSKISNKYYKKATKNGIWSTMVNTVVAWFKR